MESMVTGPYPKKLRPNDAPPSSANSNGYGFEPDPSAAAAAMPASASASAPVPAPAPAVAPLVIPSMPASVAAAASSLSSTQAGFDSAPPPVPVPAPVLGATATAVPLPPPPSAPAANYDDRRQFNNNNNIASSAAPRGPGYGGGTDSRLSHGLLDSSATHPLVPGGKAKACMKFFSTAGCQYGDSCHFLHYVPGGINALNIPPPNSFGNDSMAGAKKHSAVGGDPSVTVSGYKTKLCNKFQTREGCRFGDRCHFAHGEADLRPSNRYHHPYNVPVSSGPSMQNMTVMNNTAGTYGSAPSSYDNGSSASYGMNYSNPSAANYSNPSVTNYNSSAIPNTGNYSSAPPSNNVANFSNPPGNVMYSGAELVPPGVPAGMPSASSSTVPPTQNSMVPLAGGAPFNGGNQQFY